MSNNVFVYGTLKKGYGNHERILNGLIGYKATAPDIALHDGPGFPFAVRNADAVAIGELYIVDDNQLNAMDALEGHPGWYKRELTHIILENHERCDGWVYLNPEAHDYPIISDGLWVPF